MRQIRYRSYLWQGKIERSKVIPSASAVADRQRPKRAAREGIDASPPVQLANFCRCCIFRIELGFTFFFPALCSRRVAVSGRDFEEEGVFLRRFFAIVVDQRMRPSVRHENLAVKRRAISIKRERGELKEGKLSQRVRSEKRDGEDEEIERGQEIAGSQGHNISADNQSLIKIEEGEGEEKKERRSNGERTEREKMEGED